MVVNGEWCWKGEGRLTTVVVTGESGEFQGYGQFEVR